MPTDNTNSDSSTSLVFYGAYIFLVLSILLSVVWYSEMDIGLLPEQRDFSVPFSLIPFALSTVFLAFGNYANIRPISVNKKLSLIGSIMSGVIASAIGYIAFLVIWAIASGS